MRKSALAIAGLWLVGLALVGCGGSAEAEGEIRDLIHTAWTSSSPSVCTELSTQRFDEQVTQIEGSAAIDACEESMAESAGQGTATPAAIKVSGPRATADLVLGGEGLRGQIVRVALIKVHDQWKLASIVGFVGLDRAQLLEGLIERVEETSEELPPAPVVQCVLEAMSTLSIHGLDEYFFSASTEPAQRLLDRCTANGTLSTQ